MTRSTYLPVLLCLLAIPGTLRAQDDTMDAAEDSGPKFLMFNQNMIQSENVPEYNRTVDSLLKPILDGLADEGLISNWGILTHAWGDDWNWCWFIYTKDHAAFLTAWEEMVDRFNQQHSDAWDLLLDPIERHKDNLYDVRHLKSRELGDDEEPARFVMVNQHIVKLSDLGAANALFDSTSAAVLDAMVDEGIIHYWGQANHSWGDEWNFNFFFSSESLADFASDWAEFVNRMQNQHPEAWPVWTQLTQAHKDNLYYIRYRR